MFLICVVCAKKRIIINLTLGKEAERARNYNAFVINNQKHLTLAPTSMEQWPTHLMTAEGTKKICILSSAEI